jgi:hypothetical protein
MNVCGRFIFQKMFFAQVVKSACDEKSRGLPFIEEVNRLVTNKGMVKS